MIQIKSSDQMRFISQFIHSDDPHVVQTGRFAVVVFFSLKNETTHERIIQSPKYMSINLHLKPFSCLAKKGYGISGRSGRQGSDSIQPAILRIHNTWLSLKTH